MKLLSTADLKTLKGIPYSRTHLNRLIKDNKFPRPFKLGEGRNAFNSFVEEEIDAHLESLAAQRGSGEAA